MKQGFQVHGPGDDQGARPLGPAQLVGGKAHHVHPTGIEVHLDLARRLGGIGVDEGPMGMGTLSDRLHVLDNTGLIVGQHDRYQACTLLKGHFQGLLIHQSPGIHRKQAHPGALLTEAHGRGQHRRMFGGAHRQDGVGPIPAPALQGQVVGLGGTAGKDDL